MCPLSAQQFWALKKTTHFEKYSAGEEKRHLHVESETHTQKGGVEHVTRVTKAEFLENPVPRALRPLVDARLLIPIMTSEWCAELYGEEHCCTFSVSVPAFASFSARGRQWVIEDSPRSCTVFTTAEVRCDMPAIGGVVEHIVSESMRKSFSTYFKRVPAFFKKNPAFLENAWCALEVDQSSQTDPIERRRATCAGCFWPLQAWRLRYNRLRNGQQH